MKVKCIAIPEGNVCDVDCWDVYLSLGKTYDVVPKYGETAPSFLNYCNQCLADYPSCGVCNNAANNCFNIRISEYSNLWVPDYCFTIKSVSLTELLRSLKA